MKRGAMTYLLRRIAPFAFALSLGATLAACQQGAV